MDADLPDIRLVKQDYFLRGKTSPCFLGAPATEKESSRSGYMVFLEKGVEAGTGQT